MPAEIIAGCILCNTRGCYGCYAQQHNASLLWEFVRAGGGMNS